MSYVRLATPASSSPSRTVARAAAATVESLESRTLFAQMVFTVDPELSIIRLSAEALGERLESQGAAGLRAAYAGTITADVGDGTFQFLGDDDLIDGNVGSDLAAVDVVRALNSTRNYDPGSAPGNYGGVADGPLGIDLGEAAIRRLAFVLDSAPINVAADGTFPTGGVDVHIASGELDYEIIRDDGSEDLSGESTNNAGGQATVETVDGLTLLSIPVKITYRYSRVAKLSLNGRIVATSTGTLPYVDANGPDVTRSAYNTQFVVGTDAQVAVLDPGATVTDSDSATLTGGRVAITNLADPAGEVLAIDTAGTGITSSYDAATGVLTLGGSATVAQYQQVLRTLTYANGAADPTFSDRVLNLTLNDGTQDGLAATSTIKVWNPNVVTMGTGTNRSIVYTDTDGSSVRLSLAGPGVATVTLAGVNSQDITRGALVTGGDVELRNIAIEGSTGATRLIINGSRGDGFVNLGGVDAPDGLLTLGTRNVNLLGNVNVGGALRSATFNNVNGATLTAASIGSLNVLGTMDDTAITTTDSLRTLNVTGEANNVTITGPGTIGTIVARASVNNGTFAAGSFGSIRVDGSLANSNFTATGPVGRLATLRSLTVRQQLIDTTIVSTGNVGSIAAHDIVGSQVYAGRTGTDFFPDALADLSGGATIGSVSVRRMDGAAAPSFSGSILAASAIGTARLGVVNPSNGNEPFGVTADRLLSLTATNPQGQSLNLRRLDDPATANAAITASGFTLGDMRIRLV